MTWQQEMKNAAAKLAFPHLDITDDVDIEFDVVFDEGYRYSSYTFEDPSMRLQINVTTPEQGFNTTYYVDEEACEFFIRLMNYKEDE